MSSESGSEVVHAYPEPSTYIKLAVFLAIFTIIEVATYYIDAPVLLITLVLLVLMAVKFVLVVGYYMHLKFDSRLLNPRICRRFDGGAFDHAGDDRSFRELLNRDPSARPADRLVEQSRRLLLAPYSRS